MNWEFKLHCDLQGLRHWHVFSPAWDSYSWNMKGRALGMGAGGNFFSKTRWVTNRKSEPSKLWAFLPQISGKRENQNNKPNNPMITFFMGSFIFSFLVEKTSDTFFCLQKAISLSLAAATSEVEESSCLLSMAGSSSTAFKDFKVPETEVQQCCDTNSRKLRWQIFRSTFFVLFNATKQKTPSET